MYLYISVLYIVNSNSSFFRSQILKQSNRKKKIIIEVFSIDLMHFQAQYRFNIQKYYLIFFSHSQSISKKSKITKQNTKTNSQINQNEEMTIFPLKNIRKYKFNPADPKFYIILTQFLSMQNSKRHNQQSKKQTARKAKYDVISYEKRKELIQLVIEEQVSIYRASKITGINNATAKVIVRKFRDQGAIFVRKSQKERLNEEKSQNIQEQVSMNGPVLCQQEKVHSISIKQTQDCLSFQAYIFQTAPCYIYQTYYIYAPPYY